MWRQGSRSTGSRISHPFFPICHTSHSSHITPRHFYLEEVYLLSLSHTHCTPHVTLPILHMSHFPFFAHLAYFGRGSLFSHTHAHCPPHATLAHSSFVSPILPLYHRNVCFVHFFCIACCRRARRSGGAGARGAREAERCGDATRGARGAWRGRTSR